MARNLKAEVKEGLKAEGAKIDVDLNAVIVAVSETEVRPLILTRPVEGPATLPSGPLDPTAHRKMERNLRDWVREQTGLELGYVEQLYTFGDGGRDPRLEQDGHRQVSICYLALTRSEPDDGARWRDWYEFLPWEDWRQGRPAVIDALLPFLSAWRDKAQNADQLKTRAARIQLLFGVGQAGWDSERALERYELLWESGLVEEASWRADKPARAPKLGEAMALDHRRVLATAISRLRGKLKYRPVVFELVPATFTLGQLQRTVEALSGIRLHTQNFRRLVEKGGLVEAAGGPTAPTRGRPAERFRFRTQVLLERPAPGVGLPEIRS
jgi:hypothetical protein